MEPLLPPEQPRSPKRSKARTRRPVRELDASALGLDDDEASLIPEEPHRTRDIREDDWVLTRVRELLDDGFAGVIFEGPPGTGKTWYADHISRRLVDFENHPERRRLIQFHHSYQYEDFVEGFVPAEEGFRLEKKHLVEMCEIAQDAAPSLCVLVIDELSRSDPGRVFGEALTYIEMNKRERPFHLASGRKLAIPRNLIFLATVNPLDRGADQVDKAFERRFAKIGLDPSVEDLDSILTENGMQEELKEKVKGFFRFLINHPNQHVKVGHAYFIHAKDEESLARLWEHQLKFQMQRAFQLSPQEYEKVEAAWRRVLPQSEDRSGDAGFAPQGAEA